MVSFSLDLRFGKGEIFFFHLTNLIIHILCTLAVLFLVFNLLQVQKERAAAAGIAPLFYAVWVAGLWALNPVQTNAVTYLVQRMASIQALFFITSVAFYVLGRRRHLDHKNRGKGLPCYLACVFAAVGAFLSKENSAMLPVTLLVTEVWFFSPDLHRSAWQRLRTAPWLVWGLLIAALLIVSLGAAELFQKMTVGYGIRHFTMVERLLTEARIVVWYLSLLLWPAPSRMSLEHDVMVSTSLLNPPTTLGAIVFLAFLGWLILRYRKKLPLISYGGMWFLLNLLIESTIVPLELVFEHRLYLPSVGFTLAVVCALVDALAYLFAKRPEKDLAILGSCGFALLFSVLTLLTFSRNEAWRNTITIYQDAVQKAPNHPRSHTNLAVAYAQAELYEESVREAELAFNLGRENLETSIVAANAVLGSLLKAGRFEDGIKRAEDFLMNLPERFDGGGLAEFHLNLTQAYLKLGHLEKAYSTAMQGLRYAHQKRNATYETRFFEGLLIAILKESADKHVDLNQDGVNDPGESSIKNWIAKEFLERGEREEAKYLLTLASSENPEDMETIRLLEGIKREDELNYAQISKENMRQKYQSSPFSRFNASMALAHLARRDNTPPALRSLGEKLLDYALEIQPGVADAHLLKAYYLHDRKELDPAIAAILRALALDPDYAKAWLALGYFRMELNEFPAALSAFRKGLELYPGCPQRQSVLAVITAIEQNPALSTAQN